MLGVIRNFFDFYTLNGCAIFFLIIIGIIFYIASDFVCIIDLRVKVESALAFMLRQCKGEFVGRLSRLYLLCSLRHCSSLSA